MESDIMKVDLLGTLKITEIYYFYEEPQVFGCVNKFGQTFLGLLTDMDIREWLILPISLAQLAQLKANKISIKQAFTSAEDGFVWKVIESNNLSKAIQVNKDLINKDDLPDDELYLDCENQFMPSINNETLVREASEERRDIFDLSLLPLSKHSRELDMAVMGEILIDIQQMIYCIDMPIEYSSGKISNKVKQRNTLVATGTYAASFGIRMKSSDLSDFSGNTELSETIKKFCEILGNKNNEKELKKILKLYNPRVTLRYKKLMECLCREELAFNLSIASPNNYFFKTEYTKKDIMNNLVYLNEQADNIIKLEVLEGTMVGINVNKRRFAFETLEKEIIVGKISDQVKKIVYEVPKKVVVCLEETIQLNDFTNKEKYIYKLLEVQEAE
ncbi:DUF6575 domain-containing protein [Clostridium butyricum]|uniref:DUF6575 domain-containing protein n=2 Tax=Clostridium butyricum TaxID=1492 RepID=UPI002AB057A5|nr:DUF6575 domain-containing protein [Clostridium butyricum]